MRKIWLSVVIPVYNAEATIMRCLKSIQAQTFPKYEVIMMDDGSTDKSRIICQEYANQDKRFRYFTQENQGSMKARISGLIQARGKFVLFCDADDRYNDKHAFEKLFYYQQEYNVDLIQFSRIQKYNHLSQKKRCVKEKVYVNCENFQAEEYPALWGGERHHLDGVVWNKLYRREIMTGENLPQERIFWGDDMILNMFWLEKCRSALFIPDTLYLYYTMSGGTSRLSERSMKDLNLIKKYQLMFLKKNNNSSDYDKLRNIHGETVHWFPIYIKEALRHSDIQTVRRIIEETLQLPAFQEARKFYCEMSQEKWLALDLIREADPDQYLEAAATNFGKKESYRDWIKNILKKA